MGWSHPDISLEDLLNLIKEFVDIIILSSGYQSSGVAAIWDPSDVKKALQWGLFFEDVFRRLGISDDYQGSVKELDAALLEMKNNPYFPQGLSNLSSAALTRARDFVVRHIVHTLPLRDDHLTALLTASVELDLDDLQRTEYECLNVYIERLRLHSTYHDPQLHSAVQHIKTNDYDKICFSEYVIQELSVRRAAVSCVSSVELGLNILSESATNICKAISRNGASVLSEEQLTEYAARLQWRSRNLTYLLDKRTIRLLSGAKLIFSAPKVQWLQVFERLKVSNENDDCLEMLEILLLGCVSSIWTRLIEHFFSVSNCSLPISNQYQEVQSLPQGRSPPLSSEQENGILEYLTALLSNQLHLLWKLPPVLVAIAIPWWCPLFKLYMCEIDAQFKGDYSSTTLSCCSCVQDSKNHINCELGERIWCLHVFHIQPSHLINTTTTSEG